MASVAVFLPLTFLRDETGRLFREFAVTVAAALTVFRLRRRLLSPASRAGGAAAAAEHGLKAIFARAFERVAALYNRAPRAC